MKTSKFLSKHFLKISVKFELVLTFSPKSYFCYCFYAGFNASPKKNLEITSFLKLHLEFPLTSQKQACDFSSFFLNSGFSEKSFHNFCSWDSFKNDVIVVKKEFVLNLFNIGHFSGFEKCIVQQSRACKSQNFLSPTTVLGPLEDSISSSF